LYSVQALISVRSRPVHRLLISSGSPDISLLNFCLDLHYCHSVLLRASCHGYDSRKFLSVNYGNTDIRIYDVSAKNTTNIADIRDMSFAYSTDHTVSFRLYLRHPELTHTTIHYCICTVYSSGILQLRHRLIYAVLKAGTAMQITT
jgi:hypothetical protein